MNGKVKSEMVSKEKSGVEHITRMISHAKTLREHMHVPHNFKVRTIKILKDKLPDELLLSIVMDFSANHLKGLMPNRVFAISTRPMLAWIQLYIL